MTNFDCKVTGFLHGIGYDVEIACAIIYAVCIFYSCVGGIKVKYTFFKPTVDLVCSLFYSRWQ